MLCPLSYGGKVSTLIWDVMYSLQPDSCALTCYPAERFPPLFQIPIFRLTLDALTAGVAVVNPNFM